MDFDDRQDKRFLLKIPMLYSPFTDSYVEKVGSKLFRSVTTDMSMHGMAIDVTKPLPAGMFVNVLFEDHGENESFTAEVRWCKETENGHYRVGLAIISAETDNSMLILDESISKGEAPKEISKNCPSCKNVTTLHFTGNQPFLSGKILIPLYICASCNSAFTLNCLLEED